MDTIAVEDVIANSFKDYHVKGFDYLCMKRSEKETIKLYFFNGDVSKLPEVVNPHDHRYDFDTLCVAGEVENIWFKEDQTYGSPYETFEYRTPLNGGDGFKWIGETPLRETARVRRVAGESYSMAFHELHTIRMVRSETVLCLTQYADCLPIDTPSLTFTRDGREPPSLSGLYSRFTADEVLTKVRSLRERAPAFHIPEIH